MSHSSKDGIRRSGCNQRICLSFAVMLLCLLTVSGYAQVDPGIRGGPAGAGPAFATGLTVGERDFFINFGVPQFMEVEDVDEGLGPRFNLDSCGGCHIFPVLGGSSPRTNNPQVVRAPIMAPGSTVPGFLNIDGPIREVRFIRRANGTADGGVHDIFTTVGRSDNPAGCRIRQPNFSDSSNMIFRIPTPLFGAGLIESITDATIKENLASDSMGLKRYLGISGHPNTNGNDGTVTRFGWKAQNKSLLLFSGEAYNVEMGITNEIFPNEREENPKCATNELAENHTDFDSGAEAADIVAFMAFMRFLDQPKPACGVSGQPECSPSINSGRRLFEMIGCASCHTPSLTTGLSPIEALNEKPANLFSDLAVHDMGSGLADNVTQGEAGPSEFRTAPLWGIGQRAFFMHDGRTADLLEAILAHDSEGSEASRVIRLFQRLTSQQKQNILNFLRSL